MSRSLNSTSPRRSRGFTLVEILVVVAIIVILMAILVPVAMRAVAKARDAAIGVELSQLKAAMDEYKKEHGDYPPSMDWDVGFAANPATQQGKWWDTSNQVPTPYAYSSICERHLLRCYPKMVSADKFKFYRFIAPLLEQDEALVFWLTMIANDPREPFKNFVWTNNNNYVFYYGGNFTTGLNANDFPGAYTRYAHYDFDARRLVDNDQDGIPGYQALHSRETTYMYFDSRTYAFPTYNDVPNNNIYAARGVAQPYTDSLEIAKGHPKFVNPNTFQIVCAGQDGNFGLLANGYAGPPAGTFNWNNTKTFTTMINCNEEDSDNMTDFTNGDRLIDHRAP